jgi:y4mF family transcriptional regulator
MAKATTEIGTRVRTRRKSLGMSQSDLAAQAGVSRKWVSELENGKRTVQLDQVLDVLGVLELDLVLDLPAADTARSPATASSTQPRDDRPTSAESLNDRIRARAEAATFGSDVLASGLSAVGMDAAGRMVRYHPDGSSTLLG